MDTGTTNARHVATNAEGWQTLPVVDRIAYLDSIRRNTLAVATEWVEAAVAAKGLTMGSPLAGEEWLSGPFSLLWLLRDLRTTLVRISTETPILDGYTMRTLPNGSVSVDVFPRDFDESILFAGITAEVWLDPTVSIDNVADHMACAYRVEDPEPGVAAVLGAGNIASIAPMDVVHELFNRKRVVVLKMNPVNDYLGPIFESVFADLVDAGYVAFEYGGAEVGRRLTNDPDVTSIHVTGSARTYNAIVYGSDQEAERRRVRDERLNPRAISAELGGVTPVIVVPGRWSRADIRFQAEHIVSQKMHNSGFNCVAAQVLVLPDGWEHTQALISEISDVMASLADRPPYYPGSAERCEAAAQQTASTTRFGTDAHRYLVTDLDSSSDSPWFTDEIFGPALAVTTVSGPDVATYLANAVDFANDELAGTLGANLLVDPRTQKRHAAAVEQAVADLRYGTVCINAWVGVAYFMSRCAWGAAPGHTPAEIGSGVGHVHNALMFDEPVKSVVRGPFAPAPRTFLKGDPHVAPKMIYFVTNRQANVVGRKLIDYCAHPSKIRLASIVASAVRG